MENGYIKKKMSIINKQLKGKRDNLYDTHTLSNNSGTRVRIPYDKLVADVFGSNRNSMHSGKRLSKSIQSRSAQQNDILKKENTMSLRRGGISK